jgi:hypothetical protein
MTPVGVVGVASGRGLSGIAAVLSSRPYVPLVLASLSLPNHSNLSFYSLNTPRLQQSGTLRQL